MQSTSLPKITKKTLFEEEMKEDDRLNTIKEKPDFGLPT